MALENDGAMRVNLGEGAPSGACFIGWS